MKLCAKCKVEKSIKAFSKGTPWCKSCKSKYDAEHRKKPEIKAKAREANYKEHLYRQYKLRIDDLAALVAKQNGKCGVCDKGLADVYDFSIKRHGLVVDHDHACCPKDRSCGKCVRGLLCTDCNLGLGAFADNPAVLRAAADYIERNKHGNSL